MAITKIDANVVELQISTNLVTPAWLTVVCATSTKITGSRDINKRKTKCGTLTSAGVMEWTITGGGVASTTPEADEMSAQEVIALVNSVADFLIRATDSDEYIRSGRGNFSNYTETADEGGVLEFDFTIELEGELATA